MGEPEHNIVNSWLGSEENWLSLFLIITDIYVTALAILQVYVLYKLINMAATWMFMFHRNTNMKNDLKTV